MHGLRRQLVFLVVLTVGVLAIAGAAHAHGIDHHGHPGTVKVDDDDIDDGNANHPHVICGLVVVVTRGFGAPFDIDFIAVSSTTVAGIVTPSNGVPTQVLGEQFTNPAAAAPALGTSSSTLATTGSPFPPALAFLLIATGIILGGTWRAASGRKLEEGLRAAA